MNMDEVDGYDEAICPVDYEHEGKIVDDEINATIVRPLPRGAKLHALVDTCFSGTVLDLPFMCRMNRLLNMRMCYSPSFNKECFIYCSESFVSVESKQKRLLWMGGSQKS